MGDLEALLRDARDKTATETDVAELRDSLSKLDATVEDSRSKLDAVKRRIAKASGLLGVFGRKGSDPQADEIEVQRLTATIGVMEAQRSTDQLRLRTLQEESHGAELARAKLGAEMRSRTAALGPDNPSQERLKELDELRTGLMSDRKAAASVSALAAELLLVADGAEQADDGTDVLFVEFNSASRKREQLQSLLQPSALIIRTMLKDRLEAFRSLGGSLSAYPSLAKINSLVAEDHSIDHEVWLHRVRVALNAALEESLDGEQATRDALVAVDNERLDLLTT